MSAEQRPVRAVVYAEVFTREDYSALEIEIPRAEWDAMSPQQRKVYLDDARDEHANSVVGTGWSLCGEDAGEEVA
jgi:hypothetical protein